MHIVLVGASRPGCMRQSCYSQACASFSLALYATRAHGSSERYIILYSLFKLCMAILYFTVDSICFIMMLKHSVRYSNVVASCTFLPRARPAASCESRGILHIHAKGSTRGREVATIGDLRRKALPPEVVLRRWVARHDWFTPNATLQRHS